jgi:hypothetical protein
MQKVLPVFDYFRYQLNAFQQFQQGFTAPGRIRTKEHWKLCPVLVKKLLQGGQRFLMFVFQ